MIEPHVKQLIEKKTRLLERKFSKVEKLNRNVFKCVDNSGQLRKVRLEDNMFMYLDGKPHSYLD